ncbi:hypothetical protein FOCC_FOCC008238 [Frankliniella occidentalis]|nr:hypothetical protein FOCC_FOCC008238 [Frankliniella occidentalis]
MRRARLETYPEIPQTLEELSAALLDVNNAHIIQTEGDDFIYAGSVTARDGSHHVIFMSEEQKWILGEAEVLHADGTFKSRPATPRSSQLFCIVTTWETHVVPLCWVLMERRTISAYRAVFQFLKNQTAINPRKIITDFEYPQQRAWQIEFPRASIQGCLYHLCSAFIKKCKNLRLVRYMRHFPDIKKVLMKAVAISLLPSQYFERALQIIKGDIRRRNAVVYYLMRGFFNYVNDEWIANNRRRGWMCFFNKADRTNNACESHNRMLHNKVGAHRPNVWQFIEALKVLENNAILDVEAISGEGVEVSRARRSVSTQTRLERPTTGTEISTQTGTETGSQITSRALSCSSIIVVSTDSINHDKTVFTFEHQYVLPRKSERQQKKLKSDNDERKT